MNMDVTDTLKMSVGIHLYTAFYTVYT